MTDITINPYYKAGVDNLYIALKQFDKKYEVDYWEIDCWIDLYTENNEYGLALELIIERFEQVEREKKYD